MIRTWLVKLLTAVIVISAISSSGGVLANNSAISLTDNTNEAELKSQIRSWMSELAKQPSFEQWKSAAFEVTPLGPGTHSWLAIVKQQNTPVGYLVVQAVEQGGFSLGEYGIGSYLYNEATLQQALKQLEKTPSNLTNEIVYIHPLLAAWRTSGDVKMSFYTYFDAMSGEELPLTDQVWKEYSSKENKLSVHAGLAKSVIKHIANPSFDPYGRMPWLTNAPLQASSLNEEPVLTRLGSKKKLYYATERYDGQMLYVWAATGYDKWNSGEVFIRLETDELGGSKRYIPLRLLTELGSFYT